MDNSLRIVLSVVLAIILSAILVFTVDNNLVISLGSAAIIFFSLWIFNRKRWKENKKKNNRNK